MFRSLSRIQLLAAVVTSLVASVIFSFFSWLAGVGGLELLATALVVLIASGALLAVWWPVWHRRDVRGTLSGLVGAMDYHEGYLAKGQRAQNPNYNADWASKHSMLAREPGLQPQKRAAERAFQALARLSEGVESESKTVLSEVRAARRVLLEALERM